VREIQAGNAGENVRIGEFVNRKRRKVVRGQIETDRLEIWLWLFVERFPRW